MGSLLVGDAKLMTRQSPLGAVRFDAPTKAEAASSKKSDQVRQFMPQRAIDLARGTLMQPRVQLHAALALPRAPRRGPHACIPMHLNLRGERVTIRELSHQPPRTGLQLRIPSERIRGARLRGERGLGERQLNRGPR